MYGNFLFQVSLISCIVVRHVCVIKASPDSHNIVARPIIIEKTKPFPKPPPKPSLKPGLWPRIDNTYQGDVSVAYKIESKTDKSLNYLGVCTGIRTLIIGSHDPPLLTNHSDFIVKPYDEKIKATFKIVRVFTSVGKIQRDDVFTINIFKVVVDRTLPSKPTKTYQRYMGAPILRAAGMTSCGFRSSKPIYVKTIASKLIRYIPSEVKNSISDFEDTTGCTWNRDSFWLAKGDGGETDRRLMGFTVKPPAGAEKDAWWILLLPSFAWRDSQNLPESGNSQLP